MIDRPKFEFISQISPVETNARAIQTLTLQDVTAGGFKNPTDLANPDDPVMVGRQLERLARFPERYAGFADGKGSLVAYMKSNEWLAGDEAPFIANYFSRKAVILDCMNRGGSLDPKEYGVFGLVASDTLPNEIQNEFIYELLERSLGLAANHLAIAVNIVLHDHDPVTPIAVDLGFRAIGNKSEATGAPGLDQQRYRRLVE